MTATETQTGTQTEIINLILAGGHGNKLRAAELIRTLSPSARRDLRAALQTLDYLIDDVWLEELREKRRKIERALR